MISLRYSEPGSDRHNYYDRHRDDEMGRPILRLMQRGDEAPIFKRLLQQRVAFTDAQYAIEDVTARQLYNTQLSLGFLKERAQETIKECR